MHGFILSATLSIFIAKKKSLVSPQLKKKKIAIHRTIFTCSETSSMQIQITQKLHPKFDIMHKNIFAFVTVNEYFYCLIS